MKKNTFRLLVISCFFIAVLGGVYDRLFADNTMENILKYIGDIEAQWSKMKVYSVLAICTISLVFHAISFIGLLLFWNFYRYLYLAAFIIYIVSEPFMGIYYVSGPAAAILHLSELLFGIILGLVFWSPVRDYFR